jgi:hypothetical protein
MQHRVMPFQLEDPSKPGVRKIVAFFLVNPDVSIISTRMVPPQQRDWHDAESHFGQIFPAEVKDRIDEKRDFPLSVKQAKEFREKLMEERKYILSEDGDEFFERIFSLCEH